MKHFCVQWIISAAQSNCAVVEDRLISSWFHSTCTLPKKIKSFLQQKIPVHSAGSPSILLPLFSSYQFQFVCAYLYIFENESREFITLFQPSRNHQLVHLYATFSSSDFVSQNVIFAIADS